MIVTSIFPGRYIQGPGVVKDLNNHTAKYGKKPLVICSPKMYNVFNKLFPVRNIEEFNFDVVEFSRECSYPEIEKLTELAINNSNDCIIGFGGGKTLDTARIVADRIKCPIIIVPSIASTDAPTASVSVVYSDEGKVVDILVFDTNPELVLIDTEIISKAPVRFLVSGMGDGLATWIEAESCMRYNSKNITGYKGTLTAFAIAKLCYDTILEYGYTAKLANEAQVVTPEFEAVVEANTLMSGIGFESGGLGAAHAIHNGLVMIPETKPYYHGEKVAFGTLASLFLTNRPISTIEKLYAFCEKVGLPTTLEDIGIIEPTDETISIIAERTCQAGESIYNEAPNVKPEEVAAAIKLADLYGRNW